MNAPRWKIFLAFAAVYVIWGSTYLAIRWSVETIPPFLLSGVRFLTAGAAIYLWARRANGPATPRQWRDAAIVGGLLIVGGNGILVWSEQWLPSGLAALIVASIPMWMVLIEWLRPGGARPNGAVILGLVLGFGAVGLLAAPSEAVTGQQLLASLILLGAALSWAAGSIYARQADLPPSALLGVGMQMLAGGALLTVTATLSGEWSRLDLARISALSIGSLGYLITFGAIIGFSAYVWLLRQCPPALVSTYAFVNPVIAVGLGWALAGETIDLRTIVSTVGIVIAVLLITTLGRARTPAKLRPAGCEADEACPEAA